MNPEILHLIYITLYLTGVIGFICVFALIVIWFERKISAWIQDRLGPMETGGFHGWLQTVADMLKLLLKEDITPDAADKPLFRMAPYIVMTGTLAAFAVLPFAFNLIGSDINIGIYYLVAVSSLIVIGLRMAGWSSNNKWALYGAMRAAAQMVSYEIPIGLSLLVPVLITGSLSMQTAVAAQTGGFWNWTVFSYLPFTLVAFVVYFWASLAEVNRVPFDLPEGESELVAGFNVEYSGMRFAMFFLAEFLNLFLVAAIAATVFLGGWQGPILPSWMWFMGKAMFVVFVIIWFKWTYPRLRVDQLMGFCWKVLLPLAFLNLIVSAIIFR